MSDYLPSTEEVLDPYIWLMGRECAADREKAAQAWLTAHDREVAAKALREFMEQLQTSESVLALKLDDILNGVDWMDSGDEVARWIISAITESSSRSKRASRRSWSKSWDWTAPPRSRKDKKDENGRKPRW